MPKKKRVDEEDVEDQHAHMKELQSPQGEIDNSADMRDRKATTMNE